MKSPSDRSEQTAVSTLSGSLPKGLALLEILSSDDAPLGVTSLAKRLDIPKSGVHRLLQVMRASGWVRQTADGLYECTFKLWELGQRQANRVRLRDAAAAAMASLADRTRETIFLAILDRSEVLYLDVINSPQPVQVNTRTADRLPALCVASGKVLLAYGADDSIIDAAARRFGSLTHSTPPHLEELKAELARIQQQGFALYMGECEESVRGIAAPIFDSGSRVVAALSVGSPKERMTDPVILQLIPQVISAAKAISQELGYRA